LFSKIKPERRYPSIFRTSYWPTRLWKAQSEVYRSSGGEPAETIKCEPNG